MEKPTPEEAATYLVQARDRREKLLNELVPLCRAAERILRDIGHGSTAKEMSAALFQLDAHDGEISAYLHDNIDAIAEATFRGARGRK